MVRESAFVGSASIFETDFSYACEPRRYKERQATWDKKIDRYKV